MNAARFYVSDGLMHALLELPKNCRVSHVTFSHERHAYEITVLGDGLPEVKQGELVQEITPQYETIDGQGRFKGWGN
jgi:hypothetical protein